MVSIKKIPDEVLQQIFLKLDDTSLFNASMTCRQWKLHLLPKLPPFKQLHIDLDSLACCGRILYRNTHDTSTSLCQCNEHVVDQGIFLREILQLFGEQLSSVVVEDNLLYKNKNESINDYSIHLILKKCGENLKNLEFHLVDMGGVRVWTLAIMARFSKLTSIHFECCEFPKFLTEPIFIRMIAPNFDILESITITNNKLISDKLASTTAKKCANLGQFNVSGCSQVTALSVVSFCEALAAREDARPIILDLRNTSFKPVELICHLSNPLLSCGPCWKAQLITVNIGFDRQALVLGNAERNDVIMTIYV